MNTERLQLLSTMLGEVVAGTWKATKTPRGEDTPPEEVHFDLNMWAGIDLERPHCGFSACAIGHAGLDARFVGIGVELEDVGYMDGPEEAAAARADGWSYDVVVTEEGKPTTYYSGLTRYFDLPSRVLDWIIMPSAYEQYLPHAIPPGAVKARVDLVLKEGANAVDAVLGYDPELLWGYDGKNPIDLSAWKGDNSLA